MKFEWDPDKSRGNLEKHGIDFPSARDLWKDPGRLVIHAPYPLENRYVLIGKLNERLWTAIYTMRSHAARIISVRRSRKREEMLYEKESPGEEQ